MKNQYKKASKFSNSKKELVIEWDDKITSKYYAQWLRHNCLCSKCMHELTGQHFIDVLDINPNISIAKAEIDSKDVLHLLFSDGHQSEFSLSWLSSYSFGNQFIANDFPIQLWNREVASTFKHFNWNSIKNDHNERVRWIKDLVERGFTLIHNVPAQPGYLEQVVAEFGRIKENRIGRIFDVKFIPDPSNLAFTAEGLALHTDNPYRNPCPGLQLLHCIVNSASGGESIVVDGFHAASVLKKESEKNYDLLCNTPVVFQYKSSNTWFETKTPIISCSKEGVITQIRCNDRSLMPFHFDFDVMEDFYSAYRHFKEILNREEEQLIFKMNPGDLFIVDNYRMLHARSQFSVTEPRHLQGCYSDLDWVHSQYRLLTDINHSQKTVVSSK